MKEQRKGSYRSLFAIVMCVVSLMACSKDDYYRDGGLANPDFQGNMMQYLESKPVEFDSLVTAIKLAGLEEMLTNEDVTFFAPQDKSIKDMIGDVNQSLSLNNQLYLGDKDTIKTLADIDSAIWRKYLLRHVFRSKNVLADYTQIDFDLPGVYPGQYYYSYANTVCNIGVEYESANGVKYAGYRRLYISFIPNLARPDLGNRRVPVTSVDIQPTNGVVHILARSIAQIGFNSFDFINDVYESKR